ncbi:hypothetical protein G6F47_011220 [Rhizopus delemar]|nr:hypothetical protein G6F54_004915 [Rhizopus delemar]KAG1586428.1 hypothetical protein G6F47_011220 [Rhizopus delemar]
MLTEGDTRSITSSQPPSTAHESKKPTWIQYLVGNIHSEDDPNNYSQNRKNIIIFLVAMGGLCGPLSSMMYMPALLSVASDLHTTVSAVNGTVSAYVVFMGISPLFWAALSDQYGRKRMYLISGLINIACCIICAISKNIAMLIVFRGLQSFGANAGLTLGAGVIADTIAVEVRGSAYGIFYIGPLVGPVIGPTIGGFLCQYWSWESTFYFTAILAGILLLLTAAYLPETLRKQRPDEDEQFNKETTEDKQVKKEGALTNLSKALSTSFKPMFILSRDPTNPTITDTFKKIYGYSEWQVGLCYLPLGGGFLVGSVLSGKHSDYVLAKLSRKTGGRYSATAVGVNSFVRCIGAAITSIFSSSAVDALGNGILFSILAGINVLNAGFVLSCYFFGYRWRIRFEEKHMPQLLEKPFDNDKTLKKINSKEEQMNKDIIERVETNHSLCYSAV